MQELGTMIEVAGVDHLAIAVSDLEKSKKFYGRLLRYMGFKILDQYEDSIGWTNGKTRLWLVAADSKGRKRRFREGDVGFGHYSFELRSRKDVDSLQGFLKKLGAKIVDPAGEYYEDYYAVYFLDPDGLRFEGMHYGAAA